MTRERTGERASESDTTRVGLQALMVLLAVAYLAAELVGELVASASAWNRASVVTVASGSALHAKPVGAHTASQSCPAAPQSQYPDGSAGGGGGVAPPAL